MPKKLSKEQQLFIQRVTQVLTWRVDVIGGEIIEHKSTKTGLQYCKDHLSINGTILQKDLCLICAAVNKVFESCGSTARVNDSMGEFIPSYYTGKVRIA